MRSLRITSLRATLVLLIVGTISFVLASTPSPAERPGEVPERESLRGLAGMEVFVEPLNIEIEHLGLQTTTLQRDIKERLQKAGVNVLRERERLATPTAATLVVRVDALHDRIGRYFYCVDLFLTQQVRLQGSNTSDLSAVTWMKPGGIGLVADDNVTHIEAQVLHKVDRFIKDYLAVNPDRRANN